MPAARLLRLLAAALALATAAPAAERGLPLVRTYPPRTYGGANQVWAGVAARDGTVFFGNNNLVVTFDGLAWSKIPVPGAAHVRALAIDAEDTVWLGGVDELGRIVRAPDGRRVYESLRARVPAAAGDLREIWRVFATPEGIWFQSSQAVLRWREERFDLWPVGERYVCLAHWLDDHLLLARPSGWFRAGAPGVWEPVGDPAAGLGGYLPHLALPHPSGRGWLFAVQGPKGELAGLARWDGAALVFEPHPLDAFFRSKRLYSGARLADGRYVLGTLQGGAALFDPQLRFEAWLGEENGLGSDAAISVLPDAYGAVWIGTEFGVARVLVHPAYSWFGPPHGLRRGQAHPTLRWQDRLVVGSSEGLLRLAPPPLPPGQPRLEPWTDLDDKVFTLAGAGDTLLVGALGGLWQLDAEHARRVDRSGSNIFSIAVPRSQPDTALAATINGLLAVRRTPAGWVRENLVAEARGSWIWEADDGRFWLGTDNQGALRVSFPAGNFAAAAEIERFGTAAGLPVAGKIRIIAAGGAPLFLTTRGLYRFDEAAARFRPEPAYGARFADGSTRVETAAEDDRGTLWMVIRLAGSVDPNDVRQLGGVRDGQWRQIPLPDLGRFDGFGELRHERTAGGDLLWLNGQSAVLRIDLAAHAAAGDLPVGATLLHAAPALAWRQGVRVLAPGASPLRLRFGTPGLAGEPDVRHETRLRGFRDGAPETTAGNERTFTSLPPGDYVFEARGRSADGRWSVPATLAFRVLAPWWRTPAAWTGYAALLAAGTWAIVRRRTRALERERRRLEAVVSQRTAELADKNRELERLNRLEQDEKLAARLAEEKARLELLRYQLNPHFLFNSLNSIRALVYANPDAAGEMVTRLAEFCRWTLTRGSDETTTVADEAEMVRTYLDIEKVRWQEALVARVDIDPAVQTERLPQFLLLPLIENAIKYGGRTSPARLEVHVAVRGENGELLCEVANTGAWLEPGAAPSAASTGIGLDNLRQRLSRHYGTAWRMDIATGDGWVRLRLRFTRGLPAAAPRPASREPFPLP